MNNLKKYFSVILVFIILFFIYSFKLTSSFNFHPDFTRDIYDMLTIIQGKLSLIGPKSSFGGIYNGPYYYYLFIPIFYLTRLNIYSLLFFNLFLFILALIYFNFQITRKYGVLVSSLSTSVVGLSPMYINAARNPWNGSTYLPFLLIFLTLLYFYDFKKNKLGLVLFGLFGGVITTIHYVNLTILAFSTFYLLYFIKKKTNILYFLLGIALSFLPLVLFELKHNFVMFRNTFMTGSYKTFIENINLSHTEISKKNFFGNIIYISQNLSSQIGISTVLSIFLFFALLIKLKEKKDKFYIISSFVLSFIFIFFLRYQFVSYYLFPLSTLILFITSVILLRTKYKWLLIIIILFELYSFPKNIYKNSMRKPKQYEKVVSYVLNHKIIKKNEEFNLIEISKDYPYLTGYGYRFFLKKYDYIPKSELEYKTSNKLLIFSENSDLDISRLNNWEINQFRNQSIQNRQQYMIDGISLYIIEKKEFF